MLINLRNALMAGRRLPYDAEVEYLQSTGTQWIDTGYVPTSTSGAQVVGEFISLPTSDYSGFFGCKTTGVSDRFWAVSSNQNNGTLVGFGNNYMMASASLNTIYTTQVNYKNSRTATFTSTTNVSGFNNGGTKPVFLFAVNIGAQAYYQGSMRIYSAQLTESSEIVHDFIPVRVGTVGYMYDRVTGRLFGNAGTGDFVLGPDVVPVEWLQGDGSAYIVLPQSITSSKTTALSIECKYIADVSAINKCVFASYYGSRWYAIGRVQYNAAPAIIARFGNTGQYMRTTDLNGVYTTKIIPSQDKVIENGVEYSATFTAGLNQAVDAIGLFCAYNTNDKSILAVNSSRLYWFNVLSVDGGSIVKNLIPVRVGTDATSWEGAAMDTLTRRIYRNDGTGAFSYGNDLKYPIPAE